MREHSFIEAPENRRPTLVTAGSVVVAVLFAAISIGGLLMPSVYARETASWAGQAVAQDWFDLVIAAPCLIAAALWAAGGSHRGQLVLGGALLYTAYTLVIYAFAVHLNALFLVYCAGLGVALYTLIALGRRLDVADAGTWFDARVPRRTAGGYLIVVGVAFAGLWLLQLVPAAITGEAPPELVATGLFTNPIHVIDLAFILPLHLIAGVLLWRRRPLGFVLAPIVLAFGVLMAASIAFLVIMTGTWPVAAAMALVSLSSLVLLAAMLRSALERQTEQ